MSIPKNIFFTWYGNKSVPMDYIMDWGDICDEYSIDNYCETDIPSKFFQEALASGNWVAASNYARCYALHKYGGIYLDVDIQIVRPFDYLLNNLGFIGYERPGLTNNAVMGMQAGSRLMERMMQYMDEGMRGNCPKRMYMLSGPNLTNMVLMEMGLIPKFQWDGKVQYVLGNMVLEPEYFYPYYYDKEYTPECITDNTHTIHHWNGAKEGGWSVS